MTPGTTATSKDPGPSRISGCVSMEEADRISQLPDDLLHYILSFLSTEEAFPTSILSSRWKDLWINLPYLNFHIRYHPDYEFLHFIDKTLDKYIGKTQDMCIKRFCLTAEIFDYKLAKYVDMLVQSLTRCNIKELVLEVSPRSCTERSSLEVCYFPKDILYVNSITVLRLIGCWLAPVATNVDLVSLRILSLHSVVISHLAIERILDTSLGLEELSLENCKGLKSLKIRGLNALSICRLINNHLLTIVEIDASNLVRLRINWCDRSNDLIISSSSLRSLELSDCDD